MDIEAIKEKYPLAVDTLTGGKYYYDQQSQMIFGEENGMVCEVMDIRGWGWIQKLDTPEQRQDQIGEMLADFLNSLKEPMEEPLIKLVGHTTRELSYNGLFPAPIGAEVYKDEHSFIINFKAPNGGEIQYRYPATGEFMFKGYTPL